MAAVAENPSFAEVLNMWRLREQTPVHVQLTSTRCSVAEVDRSQDDSSQSSTSRDVSSTPGSEVSSIVPLSTASSRDFSEIRSNDNVSETSVSDDVDDVSCDGSMESSWCSSSDDASSCCDTVSASIVPSSTEKSSAASSTLFSSPALTIMLNLATSARKSLAARRPATRMGAAKARLLPSLIPKPGSSRREMMIPVWRRQDADLVL
ncbi:hypothetical protein CLOM_g18763 [Closterium sp. NIES-68]|nr:hypothetical protein CLOM_g18763 [Closterium sp. NIES-68]GJP62418.1 hypothetical protein CLOP_g19484 [Closterium sp. NIES-67]